MQQHASLLPLIEEHERLLEACRICKKDASNGALSPNEKLDFVVKVFKEIMVPHLQKEDYLYENCVGYLPKIDDLLQEMSEEHHLISRMYSRLVDSEDLTRDLDILANNLEAHILKEDEIVFQQLQVNLPHVLDQIKY
ncbi:hemerythrin HHE cation binding domain-containing protein [Chitinophaga skermanii]|uniref:Hemerythrin HHE cation binding domain-containing protein n=1 Tax=Chitinophaga skermanii TaxID=331697 RepID=A0A327QCN6_9BACT|nr:hemerythrin domain-containing protein [Chitinophaga skermanii]RAJ02230.1 hemerythrin HHE cation binding domain-containing protein [Chitinophaga skermanii]